MRRSPMLLVLLSFGCEGMDGDPSDHDEGSGSETAEVDSDGDSDDGTGTDTNGTETDTGTGGEACGDPAMLDTWPGSGFLIEFTAADQRAHLWANSTTAIDHIVWWLANPQESLGIPGGPIELDGTYNPGYSYRLSPADLTFADVWIEVCDAAPCHIEAEGPASWMMSPGTWCPWGFSALQVWDCRDHETDAPCPLVWP